MQEASLVEMRERLRKHDAEAHRLVGGQAALPELVGQRSAREILHYQNRSVAPPFGSENHGQVLMLKRSHGASLGVQVTHVCIRHSRERLEDDEPVQPNLP